MRSTTTPMLIRVVIAFIAAWLLATLWGAVVQTQYNLSALVGIGADIGVGLRASTSLIDIFSGFTPTYGGYVVLPSLLVAFGVAAWTATRLARLRWLLFALAGGLAIALGIPVVNELSPVALLVGASRDWSCIAWMALGGVAAGLLFAQMTRPDGAVPARPGDGAPRRPVVA